jgi:hypothetical protein
MVKTMKKVVKPMFVLINFYFHPKYGYAFQVTIEACKNISLLNDTVIIPCDRAIFFISDSQHLGLNEMSKSALDFLGIEINEVSSWQSQKGTPLVMASIVPNIANFIEKTFTEGNKRAARDTGKNYVEAGVTNKEVKMHTFNRSLNCFDSSKAKNMMMTYILTEYLNSN